MKGLLFSAEMALANVQGRKTETRRLAGLEVFNQEPDLWAVVDLSTGPGCYQCSLESFNGMDRRQARARLAPGEAFYQKETWRTDGPAQFALSAHFRADLDEPDAPGQWKPSIHLEARIARFFARVVDVSCERLRRMTEKGACAEGIEPVAQESIPAHHAAAAAIYPHTYAYRKLWNTISPSSLAWERNPWCWVYRYQAISREEAFHG